MKYTLITFLLIISVSYSYGQEIMVISDFSSTDSVKSDSVIARMDSVAPEREYSINARLLTAYTLMSNEDYNEALKELSIILSKDSSILNAIIFYGVAKQKTNDYPGAIKSFKKANKLEPQNVDVYYLIAETYLLMDNLPEAKKYIESSLYYDNDNYKAHLLDAKLLIKQNKLAEAEAKLLMISNHQNNNFESRFELAKLFLSKGDTLMALKYSDQAKEIRIDNIDALKFRIDLLYEMKRYKDAIEDFDIYLKKKENEADMFYKRGFAKIVTGDTIASLRDFNKSIYLNDSLAEAYYYRAIARNRFFDREGACLDINKSVEIGYEAAAALIDEYCKEEEETEISSDALNNNE